MIVQKLEVDVESKTVSVLTSGHILLSSNVAVNSTFHIRSLLC